MIRGTTPTLKFTLPFETNKIEKLYITIEQSGITITKEIQDCILSENIIETTLTQEETLMLKAHYTTKVQIRIKAKDGKALASEIFELKVGDLLYDEII